MRDIGHDETEMLLKEMEKRISKEYAQAEREIATKLNDYLEKFKVKDELKLKALENGLITEKEYKEWRIGQIMMGQRWAEMRDSLAQDFTNADKIAKSIAFGYQPEVYAINHNYGTFQVEKGSLIDTSYTLYDRHTVQELFKNEDFIPAPGRKIKAAIKEGKALAWNKKSVQSAMMQSILQGESISKIASRVSRAVGESDRKAAIRNARTMTTGVENAGRIASYERANNMGIETRKQWLATLDDRTRHWHADLDGVTVDNDEPFKNEFGEIMFPGDPKADPANIYNCRCTMIASIKGFERDVSNTDLRHNKNLKDMTYDEWKKGHYEKKSDSITKQDEIAETMRNVYGAEYASYKRSTPQEELPEVKVTRQEASDDWFEYEKANAMADYIRTGEVPTADMYGNPLSVEERAKIKAEADMIQKIGEETKTEYKTLYRGMVMDEDEVRQMFNPGSEYQFDTITATATSKDIANIYTNVDNYSGEGNPVSVVMDISKPDGIYGFKRDENEVVVPMGSTFKCTRNYMDEDGVVHVSLYAKKGDNVLTETITHGNMTVPGTFGMNLQFFAEEDIKNQSSTSLKRAIRKYEKRIAEHKEKIANPESVVPGWNENSEARKKGTIRHWEKEIRNFNNNINDRIEELKKRGDLDD